MKTKTENPNGLHQKYAIRKVVGSKREGFFGAERVITKPVDKDSEYFVMRVDLGGKDKKHIAACRKAVCYYAELIKDHLPDLSKDLIEKYSEQKAGNSIPLKPLPTVEEINKKWFYPTDNVKDEAARVGAKWLRHLLLGEVEH